MTERRTLEGGIDSDSAAEFVAKGDYLNMRNMRVTKDSAGRGMAGKPIAGTQQRSTDAATGTKRTIGSITDEVKGYIFRFNHNSNGTHKIIAFDRRTNQTYTVLQESNVTGGLDFDTDYMVTGLALIGDYLYWTDNLNQPRRIDVERGIRTNHPTYVSQDGTTPDPYTLPLEQWDITVARRVPRYAPNIEKIISADDPNVEDQPTSLIYKNGFQFTYRYIYSTDEQCTVGPYSRIAPNNKDEEEYDTIKVQLDKREPIEPEVDRIEFLVRQDNIGSWYIIKTFDRIKDAALFSDHNTPGDDALTFYFFNDTSGIPVPDPESYLPYFDVPVLSNALEIADNRVFLGNNIKGYDHPTGMDIVLGTETSTGNIIGTYFLVEWNCGGPGLSELVLLYVPPIYGSVAGWYPTPFSSSQFNSNSLPPTFTTDISDRYPVIDLNVPPVALLQYLNPTCSDYTFTTYTFLQPEVLGLGTFFDNVRVFRDGKRYKVHVVFYDFAHRNAGVMHDPEEVVIPKSVYEQDEYVTEITWTLQNDPSFIPLWADSYSVVRTRVTEPFFASYLTDCFYGEKEEDGVYDLTSPLWSTTRDAIGFDVTTLINVGIGYTFSEGDIAKVIMDDGSEFLLTVIGTQGVYILTEAKNIANDLNGKILYFEVFTRIEQDENYWEVGQNFRVLNPGTPSRTMAVATGSLTGDTFVVRRELNGVERTVQAMNPNNKYWTIWPQDYGRPTALLYSKQRRYETEVAWSSTYFPGTETNQLNQFLSGDIRTLDSGLGQIQMLRLTSRTQDYGTVMLALGQTEVASMYLGRTEFYNAAETPSLINTVDVIGTINILRGGFGTLNPESFVENDGDAYWFSAIKSAFVRYSKAGVEPISDRKFSVFAAWLGNLVLTTANDVPGVSNIKIPAGYDEFNKEAIWTIPAIGNWPIQYPVLDVEENITITESPVGSVTASLVAGAVYRLTFFANGPTQVSMTCNDLFFGTKTLNSVGTMVPMVFVAAATGNYTFIVTSTPALPTVVHSFTLKKLRPNPYTITDLYPKTVVFSEEKGRFAFFFDAVPEWWGRAGDRLFSMKGGQLFSHDSITTNSFHGIRYASNAVLAFNQPPNEVKRLQGISLEGTGAPAYAHFRTEDDFVQSSDLVAADFRKQEGIWSASALRDRLSPNTPGTVLDKLYKGDELRGRYVKCLLEWSSLTTFVVKIINLLTRNSSGNKT